MPAAIPEPDVVTVVVTSDAEWDAEVKRQLKQGRRIASVLAMEAWRLTFARPIAQGKDPQ